MTAVKFTSVFALEEILFTLWLLVLQYVIGIAQFDVIVANKRL